MAHAVLARGYRGYRLKSESRGVAGGEVWLWGPYTPKGPAAVAAVTTEQPTRVLAHERLAPSDYRVLSGWLASR